MPAWTARRADAGQSGRHDWFDQAFDEARFLKLLGRKLRRAAKDGAFRYLVLMAPPKALGALREGLSDAADRVEVSDPHEHTHASKVQIEAHLRALRQPT